MRKLVGCLVGCLLSTLLWAVSATAAEPRRCPREPYPCGGEWPVELVGRDDFTLDRIDEVQVVADDGVALDGWIAYPRVPPGTKVPTVLSSSPYYDTALPVPGAVYRNPASQVAVEDVDGTQGWWSEKVPLPLDVNTHSAGFPPQHLLRKGYALAYFSVRGTGHSGGCFDGGGAHDQADQKKIVDWIGAQPWSNGRVGMVGLSFPSWYSWQAAVAAPPALKTIITAGDLIDIYQWMHTPQGANSLVLSTYYGQIAGQLSLLGGGFVTRGEVAGRTGCDPGRFLRQDTLSVATGDRNADYYAARTLSGRFGNIEAAVLDTSGYLDFAGHYGQDSAIWGSLDPKTPRVRISGYWGHNHPAPWNPWGTRLHFPSGDVDWEQYVTRWLDYWLKGVGPEPRTNVVYHEDQNRNWHEATSWSPEPRAKEVLYLAATGLSATPTSADVTFRSAPHPLDAQWLEQTAKSLSGDGLGEPADEGLNPALCPTALDAGLSHAYMTPAVSAPTLIAGNPMAYLNLSSDEPGGSVAVSLYDVEPTFACTGAHATGARYIASGSADLNFYRTPYLSHAFRVNTPTKVRIDLSDTTYMLGAGHRLVAIVSNGGPYERSGSHFTPNITIYGAAGAPAHASHVVVPVASGTLGGERPTIRYPRRPFTPAGYTD